MCFLTVVVPVYNEENYIVNTLNSLTSQNYPQIKYEILVVDGGSTDRTQQRVCEFIDKNQNANVSLRHNPKRLSSSARNIGVRAAKGELVAIIDGHVFIPNNELFLNMEKTFIENDAKCLSRPAPLDVPGLTVDTGYWVAIARKSWLGHSSKSFIYKEFKGFVDPMSAGFAYARSLFDIVGFFDENFDAAEDVEFHYRLKKAGIQSYISSELLIYSYPRETLKSLCQQQVRYGEGRANLVFKHPAAFTKETLVPVGILMLTALFFLSFFVGALSGFWTFLLVLLPFFVTYLLVVFATGLVEGVKRKSFFGGIVVGAAIWVTHVGLGYGFLRGAYMNYRKNRHLS